MCPAAGWPPQDFTCVVEMDGRSPTRAGLHTVSVRGRRALRLPAVGTVDATLS
jgi:hypothetical protein